MGEKNLDKFKRTVPNPEINEKSREKLHDLKQEVMIGLKEEFLDALGEYKIVEEQFEGIVNKVEEDIRELSKARPGDSKDDPEKRVIGYINFVKVLGEAVMPEQKDENSRIEAFLKFREAFEMQRRFIDHENFRKLTLEFLTKPTSDKFSEEMANIVERVLSMNVNDIENLGKTDDEAKLTMFLTLMNPEQTRLVLKEMFERLDDSDKQGRERFIKFLHLLAKADKITTSDIEVWLLKFDQDNEYVKAMRENIRLDIYKKFQDKVRERAEEMQKQMKLPPGRNPITSASFGDVAMIGASLYSTMISGATVLMNIGSLENLVNATVHNPTFWVSTAASAATIHKLVPGMKPLIQSLDDPSKDEVKISEEVKAKQEREKLVRNYPLLRSLLIDDDLYQKIVTHLNKAEVGRPEITWQLLTVISGKKYEDFEAKYNIPKGFKTEYGKKLHKIFYSFFDAGTKTTLAFRKDTKYRPKTTEA